jgi:GNAT superfamily N-acetyltransferase
MAGPAAVRRAMEPVRVPSTDPYDWTRILQESQCEGYGMVARLLAEYRSGANRFDAPGEALFACLAGDAVVAVGGLSREPDRGLAQAGRVRRLYVRPAFRGQGLGRALVEAIAGLAEQHFDLLTVNVGKLDAHGFYEHVGFARVEHAGITHVRELASRR